MAKLFKREKVLLDQPTEIVLSPCESKIFRVIKKLPECNGTSIAARLKGVMKLDTIYVLLARMEKKGVLSSRVAEGSTNVRRVIIRLYKISDKVLTTQKPLN